ncbi:hypothetical protein DPX16_11432 [Anabarilius grahami]|uniref:Uncharacterized protein n=1 Tax=Anabarilius grahami TaxID=495550 RepID=A0A3N0YHX7_ANAGA|nr:hypothetical protein DPX16_11432 [Anabarilius grahami]
MYAVVTLQDSDEVMVVASKWLTTDKKQSYWPPFKSPENKTYFTQTDKKELLQMLRDIKSTVQENSVMLKKLMKDNTVSEAPSSTSVLSKDIKTNLNLPLKTFDDVDRIERELNTAELRKEYVNYLSGLGGFGPRDIIKNIMQRVFTDDLAKEFNWQGRGDKRPFSQLILADVIRDAAYRQNVIRVNCENEIKKYLSYRADRLRKKPREQGDEKFQKLQNADVVFFQETHIGVRDENIIEGLKNEWHVFYTTFTSQKGTAILVRKRLDFECISDEKDNCGAYVVLKCKLEGQLYTLVSVYNHETDTKTLEKLSSYLQSMTTGLLVIGGDFNMVLNPFIDKDNSKAVKDRSIHRKLRCCVNKLMKSFQLVDVWRRKNPVNQYYTFHSQMIASRLDYFFVPEECMWRVRSCEIKDSKMRDHCPVSLEINNVSTTLFQKDPQIQSISQWLNLKKDLLTDETGSSLGEESSDAVSGVDIVSAVQSLQVSDTPRPDGIPVSFYKDNIQELIPYIKKLYDRIHSSAFNCSEKHFNITVKSPHDDSQHFFNVDYLIIATILTKRLDDFLESQSKGQVPKKSATVMITPKTFCTEMRLSCIKDKIEEQKRSNPNLYQDFLVVKNLLRDAPEVGTEPVDVSIERDKLLDQGCPLTPVLITLALKCFASALAGRLKQNDILVFKESVILCIQPEDLEKVIAAVRNRDNEVYYIKELSKGNINGKQLKCLESESKDEDWNKRKEETLVYNTEDELEASWSKMDKGNTKRRLCEEHDFFQSIINEEKDILMEGDGRLTMYAVVTLQDSDEVMVVASNWLSLDKKQSYWPPFKSSEKCMDAVQNRLKPETGGKTWEKINVSFHKEYDKDDLLQMLRDIKSTVQENSAMLKKLLKENTVSESPSSTSVPIEDIETDLNLPLRTIEDVVRTEMDLSNTTTREKYVSQHSISRKGSCTLSYNVHSNL